MFLHVTPTVKLYYNLYCAKKMADFITCSFNNLIKLLLFVVMFVYMVCFVVVPGFVDMNLIVFVVQRSCVCCLRFWQAIL